MYRQSQSTTCPAWQVAGSDDWNQVKRRPRVCVGLAYVSVWLPFIVLARNLADGDERQSEVCPEERNSQQAAAAGVCRLRSR